MFRDFKRVCVVLAGTGLMIFQMGLGVASAAEPDLCSPLPRINPRKSFLDNFSNPCYAIKMGSGNGATNGGDLNAVYNIIYYQVVPGYELVVTGTFPNARYFSATVYDAHSVEVSTLLDTDIPPLKSSMINPYAPGVTWIPGQQYGLTVGYGSPPPTNVTPGCSTSGTTIDQNYMDASLIHSGLTWTGDPTVPPDFPPHQTGPNPGGYVMIRRYFDISTLPAPTVIVRQLSDGCAVSVSQAVSLGLVTGNPSLSWMNNGQIQAHNTYANDIQPEYCYGTDPRNGITWRRSVDYIAGDNFDAAYALAGISKTMLTNLIATGAFIRLRFPAPSVPDTPCATGNCARTGNEQLRYFSLSFLTGRDTLVSIKDSDMVHDPTGNVTILVGLGTQPPAFVTPAHYYTYVDLSKVTNPANLTEMEVRDILTNTNFSCSSFNIPHRYTEYNPDGGYMGPYVPTVDYPTGSQLPTVAGPLPHPEPNNCSMIPTQPPSVCQ